ncbi:MAG: hypothetical protein K0R51_2645 [Cytophagaceae bacterium]|jgi:uncharacterized protein (DUF488 family)|nr:hypothetical protein [Cytophagaceae bacterium]
MQGGRIYTIGHGTRKAEDFLALLKAHDIQYLVDVRSVPRSRFNPQYNQKTVQQFLESKGITYVFMGDQLGGRPQNEDCYDSNGHVNYEAVNKKEFFKKGIERLKSAHDKKLTIALMCSESKPQECHRSRLIGVALSEEQLDVIHIDEKGALKNQQDVMRLVKGSQTDLF